MHIRNDVVSYSKVLICWGKSMIARLCSYFGMHTLKNNYKKNSIFILKIYKLCVQKLYALVRRKVRIIIFLFKIFNNIRHRTHVHIIINYVPSKYNIHFPLSSHLNIFRNKYMLMKLSKFLEVKQSVMLVLPLDLNWL